MRALIQHTARARAADLRAALSVRAFALYQLGNLSHTIGFWMQRIAVGWSIWQLTQSEAWLGLVAFAELFPSLLTSLLGGRLADRFPAPQIMMWGQLCAVFVSVGLAVAVASEALTPMLLVAAMTVLGVLGGAILPARLAMAAWLLPKSLLPTGLAVNSSGFNLSRFIGPAVAAALLTWGGAGVVFTLTAAVHLVFVAALWSIRHVPRAGGAVSRSAPPSAQVFRDLARTPEIWMVMGLQFIQGLLIRPASELFPAYAEQVFDRGAAGLGALNAALGLGAIIGVLALSADRPRGRMIHMIVMTSAVFGLSLLAFTVTRHFGLALLILAVHGAAMSSANISAMSFVQIETPPERLGRVLSLYTIVFRVGPAFGAFLFGLAAERAGLGVAGAAFALLGLGAMAGIGLLLIRWARGR